MPRVAELSVLLKKSVLSQHLRDPNPAFRRWAEHFLAMAQAGRPVGRSVPFEIQTPPTGPKTVDQDFRLDCLVPEFLHFKGELEAVLNATRGAIENLRLRPLQSQKAKDLLQLFVDRGFHRLGLHGVVAVPFLLGLGCNVPALSAIGASTRGRERVAASLLVTFVPCSARSAIILAIAGKYLGAGAVLAIWCWRRRIVLEKHHSRSIEL